MKNCVLQDWILNLTFMQQSVLLTALRGPDTINKNHISKLLIRWMRRCILKSAFDQATLTNPYYPGGGSFTGPSIPKSPTVNYIGNYPWEFQMNDLVKQYLQTVDELPHHFQLHFMHSAEIIGYKHPDERISKWWKNCYHSLVNDLHLSPETKERMEWRLGDKEDQWRKAEEVTAKSPENDSNKTT